MWVPSLGHVMLTFTLVDKYYGVCEISVDVQCVCVLYMCVCVCVCEQEKSGGAQIWKKIICTLIFRERRNGQYCLIQIDTQCTWKHGQTKLSHRFRYTPVYLVCLFLDFVVVCFCFLAQLKDCLYYLFLRILNFEMFVK